MCCSDGTTYFILEGGDYDLCYPKIERVLHLIRLGSESTDKSCDLESEFPRNYTQDQTMEDEDFIYIFTPPKAMQVSSILLSNLDLSLA